MGNGPVEGDITSILKNLKVLLENAPFFLIFAGNAMLLSRNKIKLIPLGSSTSKYKKSAFYM